MTAPAGGDSSLITILGDIIVTGGAFSSNGTSNANTKITVHQYGDIVVTGGNLSVSRGSQGSGTGSTRWHLHQGNFSMTNGTTQNSNPTNAWFVFDKPGEQLLTLGAGNTLTALPIVVSNGTTLNGGTSEIRGSGLFTLNAGATLATANEGGVDSAVSITGTLNLSSDANYTFNGTVDQVTGLSMPATVADITISNPTRVRLSQHTTINDTLHLRAGMFDVGAGFTLGPNGVVSNEGGTLVSVEETPGEVPPSFFVDQNYPNPFNPTTTIRFGLPEASVVSVKIFNILGQEVEHLFGGQLGAGTYHVEIDAARLVSGVYFCRVEAGSNVDVKRLSLVK
jgi:hypothetical protein